MSFYLRWLLLLPFIVLFVLAIMFLLWSPIANQSLADKADAVIAKQMAATNVADLIRLQQAVDIQLTRQLLTRFIFAQQQLPLVELNAIKLAIQDDDYLAVKPFLLQIDRLEIVMEYGINSVMHHLIPKQSNRQLIIYQQGNMDNFLLTQTIIASLLQQGYEVLALTMPLLGKNNQPMIDDQTLGSIQLQNHHDFNLIQVKTGDQLKFFILPLLAASQYTQQQGQTVIAAIGMNQGAWVTTLYAALKPDLLRHYAIETRLPRYLMGDGGNDYQQNQTRLYRLANQLELYLMAAYGKQRKQLIISSDHRHQHYQTILQQRLQQLGLGRFQLVLSANQQQDKLAQLVISSVLADLNKLNSLQK